MTATTDAPDTSANPLDAVLDREATTLANRALAELDDADREVVTLYYREDQSIDSVASSLGITAAAARQRLHRGRERLKSALTVVERTLHTTRPTPAFTAACIAGLAATGVAASTAHAATGVSVSAAPEATLVMAKSSTSPWLGTLAIAGIAVVTIGAASVLGHEVGAATDATVTTAANARGSTTATNAVTNAATANDATSIVHRIDANRRTAMFAHIARAIGTNTGANGTGSNVGATRLAPADAPWDPSGATKTFDFSGDVLDGSNAPASAPRPGPLNKATMRRAIRDVHPLLYECYTSAAKSHPTQPGTIHVILRLVGDDQGTLVDAVRVDGDIPLARDPELGECVRETLMTIALPAMPEPGTWDVYYPFTFR